MICKDGWEPSEQIISARVRQGFESRSAVSPDKSGRSARRGRRSFRATARKVSVADAWTRQCHIPASPQITFCYTHSMKRSVAGGTVHRMPADLRRAVEEGSHIRALWHDITPLARNEWICWVTSAKKSETRATRLEKAVAKLKSGMRRPCCWAGCPHR